MVGRPELVSAVFAICFLNGLFGKAYFSIEMSGLWPAIYGVFGVSVLIYACAYLVISDLVQADEEPVSKADLLFFGLVLLVSAVPAAAASWVAMTILGLRTHFNARKGSRERRAATLMLGITMASFWGKVVFSLASGVILKGDAILVAFAAGAERTGNVVHLPTGDGFMWIANSCSSFTNLSLAMLCWLTFSQFSGRTREPADYMVCFVACVNVVMINVARMTLMARRPELYDLIHGPVGSTVIGYIETFVVVMICWRGLWREPEVGRDRTVRPSG